jgi:hypothetical protein
VGEVLQVRGLKVGAQAIVDATIVGAPSSTKNKDKQRDPSHIEHVAQRIRELTALKKQLVALRGQCAQAKDVAHCGILSGLGQGEALEQPTARQHVSASHGKRR